MDAVLAAVPEMLSPESVRELVLLAWSQEASAVSSATEHGDADPVDEGRWEAARSAGAALDGLRSQTGPPRVRRDAVVMPMSWSGAEAAGLPPLESDVEFTSFGDDRTHVHLYGRTSISSVAEPGTKTASVASRVAVAVVRRFLDELVERIESSIPADGIDGLGDADSSVAEDRSEPVGS